MDIIIYIVGAIATFIWIEYLNRDDYSDEIIITFHAIFAAIWIISLPLIILVQMAKLVSQFIKNR